MSSQVSPQQQTLLPASFSEGFRASAPILLGYLPIGFAFGVLGRTAGLTVAEIGLMSLLVYAGSSQFVGAGMYAAGAAGPAIISTTFLVNLRHLLMSTALVPSMRGIKTWKNALLAYNITDESFALTTSILQGRPATAAFMAGVQVTAQINWVLASVAGALAGQMIADTRSLGLDFALPAMFVGLLMPHLRGAEKRPRLISALTAAVATVAAGLAFPGSGWSMIAATLVGATLGVMSE